MLCSAALIASRYMSSMLWLPPEAELANIWAWPSPAFSGAGKKRSSCSTLPVDLIQLSSNTACICPTTGPSTR